VPQFGLVEAPADVNSYEVEGGQITGYREIHLEQPISAPATRPRTFKFPTFSDPDGVKRLVRVTDGPYRGVWLSPDDDGVTWSAGG
jgi:hypothetical protein